jgi:hypothetical protein
MSNKFMKYKQAGQTLIETIVAIFILTTTLTAGLALTIYVLSHSDQTFNEIVATNLAREGVDVIKNMRDTNWLEDDAVGGSYDLKPDCHDDAVSPQDAACYPRVYEGVSGTGYHNYDLTTDGSYSLQFNPTSKSWSLSTVLGYGIYLQPDGTYTHTSLASPPKFFRKVVITRNTGPSFSNGPAAELIVTSVVGWVGKGCSGISAPAFDPALSNCSVTVTERLTNWKDYN